MPKTKTNPDIVETQMSKEQVEQLVEVMMTGTEAEIEAFVEARASEFLAEQAKQQMQLKLLQQVAFNVHYLLHEETKEDTDTARQLLCVTTALLMDKPPPMKVLKIFMEIMNRVAMARALGDCEGHA